MCDYNDKAHITCSKGGAMRFLVVIGKVFWLLHCLSAVAYGVEDDYSHLVAHDTFFPSVSFKKIEKICFQLSIDLDVFTHQALPDFLEHSGYLLKQFCSLFVAVQEMVCNTEESRMFLSDDISYLLNLLIHLEHLLAAAHSNPENAGVSIVECMKILLDQAILKLESLIEHNIEVVFDPTKIELHLVQY